MTPLKYKIAIDGMIRLKKTFKALQVSRSLKFLPTPVLIEHSRGCVDPSRGHVTMMLLILI